jgi:hypothetical protein
MGDVVTAPDELAGGSLLERLEREERELSRLRRKLHDRLASFPNPITEAREREVSRQRRELHARIDSLRSADAAREPEDADRPPVGFLMVRKPG